MLDVDVTDEEKTPPTRIWKRSKYPNEEAPTVLALISIHGVERLPGIDNTTMNLRISILAVLSERNASNSHLLIQVIISIS